MTRKTHYDSGWLTQWSAGLQIAVDSIQQDSHAMHDHVFHELAIVESGSGFHVLGDDRWAVSAGDVFMIPPGVTHGYEVDGSLTVRNVLFSQDVARGLIPTLYTVPGVRALLHLEPSLRLRRRDQYSLKLTESELHDVLEISSRIHQEGHEKAEGYCPMVESLLVELIVFLARRFGSTGTGGAHLLQIASALTYMETHAGDFVSLKHVAVAVGMSVRTFDRRFTEALGQSPAKYLADYRMGIARRLLVQSNDSVTSVALRCGFPDSGYFSRVFRRAAGTSPREYRRAERVSR